MPESLKQQEEYKKIFRQFELAKPDNLYNVYQNALDKATGQKRDIINAAFSHYISTPGGQEKVNNAMKIQAMKEEIANTMTSNVDKIFNKAFSMKTSFTEYTTELAESMDSKSLKKAAERHEKCAPIFEESKNYLAQLNKAFSGLTGDFKEGKVDPDTYVAKSTAIIAAVQFEMTRVGVAVGAALDESEDKREYLNNVAGALKNARDNMLKVAVSGTSADDVVARIKITNSNLAKDFLKDTNFMNMVRMWHGVDQGYVAEATKAWFNAEKSLKNIANGSEISGADAKNIGYFIALNAEGIGARESRERAAITTCAAMLSIYAVGTLTPILSEYVGSHTLGGMLSGGFSEAGAKLGLDAVFGRVGTIGEYSKLFGLGAVFGGVISASEAHATIAKIGSGALRAEKSNIPNFLDKLEKLYKTKHTASKWKELVNQGEENEYVDIVAGKMGYE
ncbi:MAG: hypothetical protein N3G76_01505 [Candidatus Micrarchaeota archaeon]|nr:hypothetical protein [Candidatus Micrarchaeota archaeon]